MRSIRILFFSALLIGLMSSSLASVAQTTTESTVSATTGTGEPVAEPRTPAVTIVEVPPEEVLQPWTIRYLIPTSIAIAGLLVFSTVVQYFVKVVRTRYKTVE